MSRTTDVPPRAEALILALDIGSSSVRSAFLSERGARLHASSAKRTYTVDYSVAGGAELKPETLLRAARAALRETLQWRRSTPAVACAPIIAVAGSAFWHSLLALDRQRRPLSPALMWADSRPTAQAASLREELRESTVHARTGCMLRAPYWPAKILWLRHAQANLFRRTAHWVSPAAWIYGELFGVAVTSHSMASGTGLYNLRTRAWDSALAEHCGIKMEALGPLADVAEVSASPFPELRGVPLFPAIGDGAASNLGSGADGLGVVAINIGTSAAVREIVPAALKLGQLASGLFRHVVDSERFVIGGAISNAGNLREWTRRTLMLSSVEAKVLDRSAAAASPLVVQPSWVNERAPSWPGDVRGAITGLTPTTTADELGRAITAATYYRLADILDLLCTKRSVELIVSGGVLHSPASLRLLADCIGQDLRVSREMESSLRGGALHALRQLGLPVPRLASGKTILHRPDLAELHHARRLRQRELEQRLA